MIEIKRTPDAVVGIEIETAKTPNAQVGFDDSAVEIGDVC